MTRSFERPLGGDLGEARERYEQRAHGENQIERHWPLINADEDRFIEETGGQFAGYVEAQAGARRFEDVVVDHVAYYDETERAVVEAFVATEAVNDEGENELHGPSEIAGFTLMIVRRTRQGQEMGAPSIFSIRPEDFPNDSLNITGLRRIGNAAHMLVLEEVKRGKAPEALQSLVAYLESEGWRSKTMGASGPSVAH